MNDTTGHPSAAEPSADQIRIWLRQPIDHISSHRETAEIFAQTLSEFGDFAQHRPTTRPGWEEAYETDPLRFVIDPDTISPHVDVLLGFVEHVVGVCRREETRLETQLTAFEREAALESIACEAEQDTFIPSQRDRSATNLRARPLRGERLQHRPPFQSRHTTGPKR